MEVRRRGRDRESENTAETETPRLPAGQGVWTGSKAVCASVCAWSARRQERGAPRAGSGDRRAMAAAGPVPGLRAGGFVRKPACFGACRVGCQRRNARNAAGGRPETRVVRTSSTIQFGICYLLKFVKSLDVLLKEKNKIISKCLTFLTWHFPK